MIISPTGRICATGTDRGSISIYNTSDAKLLHTLNASNTAITAMAFADDDKALLAGTENGRLKLISCDDAAVVVNMDLDAGAVNGIALPKQGSTCTCSTADGRILRIAISRKEILSETAETRRPEISCMTINHGGDILALGCRDRMIRLCHAATGKELKKCWGHTSCVTSVSYSPDGSVLASASRDNSVCTWDAATGYRKNSMRGHTAPVNSICFSPCGDMLLSASDDGSVRVWQTATGTRIKKLASEGDEFAGAAFHPDLKHIIVATRQSLHKVPVDLV
jgi:WD40 repeat protein